MVTADDSFGADGFAQKAQECWEQVVQVVTPLTVTSAEWLALKRQAELAFGDFFESTIDRWRAQASRMLRRWKSPTEIDDVLQEMRLALWQRFMRFDPNLGVSIGKYLRFQASVGGRRWVHQERGANKHGTRDKNPSRFALPFSSLVQDDGGGAAQFEVPAEALQERIANVRQLVQRCGTDLDRRVVEALVREGGAVDVVARELFIEMDPKIGQKLVFESLLGLGIEVADFRGAAA